MLLIRNLKHKLSMKKFFLNGDYSINVGPQNVNRSWVECSDGKMVYIKSKNRFLRKIESFIKCLIYPSIVFSGDANMLNLFVSNILGKRIVYIMHGCCKYENAIDHLGMSEKQLKKEYKLMNLASIIVAVSENYAAWSKRMFPQYSNKITFVNNGLHITDKFFCQGYKNSDKKYIAVSGGNRPIKSNLDVCKAVNILNENKGDIIVYVFGTFQDNGDNILDYPFVKCMGQLNKLDYYNILKTVDLFVVNSEVESFGLVVGDALNCGCSLLMSKNVGALSIFEELQDSDIVQNNHDVTELSNKIGFLLSHSNAERLYDNVDRYKCSTEQSYIKLQKICLNGL